MEIPKECKCSESVLLKVHVHVDSKFLNILKSGMVDRLDGVFVKRVLCVKVNIND